MSNSKHNSFPKRNSIPSEAEEISPAYHSLRKANLLATQFRVHSFEELDFWPANSTPGKNFRNTFNTMSTKCKVDSGTLAKLQDGKGGYFFLGPGNHLYRNMFYKIVGHVKVTEPVIQFGDRTIVTVAQGFVGIAEDRGRPVLLPPGLHQWTSSTMTFQSSVDLTRSVVQIGPYTLVTVDEGYAAVTQNNGKMEILEGGNTYFLEHRNHKFEMFISQKIQTDELRNIQCATADNVVIGVQASVNWRIINVETAARLAADTMLHGGGMGKRQDHTTGLSTNNNGSLDLGKLRNDVLQQAEASLSAYLAVVNYSDTFGVQHSVNNTTNGPMDPVAEEADNNQTPPVQSKEAPEASPIFDLERLDNMIEHANEVTKRYGVQIFSINIISAFPVDQNLMKSLAAGAVAAAEARQMETAAKGKKVSVLIEAQGQASARLEIAKSEALADEIRAQGALKAAKLLETSQIASDLARIERAGKALGNRTAFFFGSNPEEISNQLIGSGALNEKIQRNT